MVVEYPVHGGKYVTLVDESDVPMLDRFHWNVKTVKGKMYVYANVSMHRLIMDAPEGKVVDHQDGNSLHNTRANLRVTTHARNMCNRAGKMRRSKSTYKGTHLDKERGRWRVDIQANKVPYRIMSFDDEKTAALAYDCLARFLHGEYASLNFPERTDYPFSPESLLGERRMKLALETRGF